MFARTTIASLALCLLAGCVPDPGGDPADAGPDEANPDGVTIRGPVTALEGFVPDPDAQLFGLWIISAGSPDRAHVWGHGAIEGDRFVFRMPATTPPEDALNIYRPDIDAVLGVGVILALPAGAAIPPDGPLDRDAFRALEAQLIGGAGQFGIIYVEGDGWPADHWGDDFEGLRIECGRGYETGGTFDAFEPIECDEVELRFGTPLEIVNWT